MGNAIGADPLQVFKAFRNELPQAGSNLKMSRWNDMTITIIMIVSIIWTEGCYGD
jgi:hypothetical protein